MRPLVITLLGTGLLLASNPPAEQSEANELERLEGTWRLVSLVVDGKETLDTELVPRRCYMKGSRFCWMKGYILLGEGDFFLGPAGHPRSYRMTYDGGPTFLGVYELDGNTSRSCSVSGPGKDPSRELPTNLGSEPGSGQTVMKCVRDSRTSDPPVIKISGTMLLWTFSILGASVVGSAVVLCCWMKARYTLGTVLAVFGLLLVLAPLPGSPEQVRISGGLFLLVALWCWARGRRDRQLRPVPGPTTWPGRLVHVGLVAPWILFVLMVVFVLIHGS